MSKLKIRHHVERGCAGCFWCGYVRLEYFELEGADKKCPHCGYKLHEGVWVVEVNNEND
jgi:hypothetical protein